MAEFDIGTYVTYLKATMLESTDRVGTLVPAIRWCVRTRNATRDRYDLETNTEVWWNPEVDIKMQCAILL